MPRGVRLFSFAANARAGRRAFSVGRCP